MQSYWDTFKGHPTKLNPCISFEYKNQLFLVISRSWSGHFLLTRLENETELCLWALTQHEFKTSSFPEHWSQIPIPIHFRTSIVCYIDERRFFNNQDLSRHLSVFIILDDDELGFIEIEITWASNEDQINEINIFQKRKHSAAINAQIEWIQTMRDRDLRCIQEMIWRRELSFETPHHFVWISEGSVPDMLIKNCMPHNSFKNRAKLCLLKLLILEQNCLTWTIDENICSLMLMTTSFDFWITENPDISIKNELNNWLDEFITESNETFFFVFAHMHPFHVPMLEWFEQGAPPNFFRQDRIFKDSLRIQTMSWYLENKRQLIFCGKQKICSMSLDDTQSAPGPTIRSLMTPPSCAKSIHLHLLYTFQQIEAIKDHILYSDSRFESLISEEKIELGNLFSTFQSPLFSYLHYAELIEMLITVMYRLRIQFKKLQIDIETEIEHAINSNTAHIRHKQHLVREIQSIFKSVFSTNYDRLWHMSNERMQSVLSPHVFAALRDFISAGQSPYPAVCSATDFMPNL